jgi:hypothetical protein
MGDKRNSYRILVGKPERKRPLRRPKCRWVQNFKMNLREIGWDDIECIDQWRALVNMVTNLWVPEKVGKFLSSCTTGGFTRMAHLHGVS